jgi:hypothetical protein
MSIDGDDGVGEDIEKPAAKSILSHRIPKNRRQRR